LRDNSFSKYTALGAIKQSTKFPEPSGFYSNNKKKIKREIHARTTETTETQITRVRRIRPKNKQHVSMLGLLPRRKKENISLLTKKRGKINKRTFTE
jgi:hypothetical protein